MGVYDDLNRRRLSELQPHVAKAAMEAIEQAERESIEVLVTQGLRTYAEQDALYEQGRTKPGKIVTNARGGYSYHNFGLAFDFVLIEDGKAVWSVNSKWKRFAAICKAKGFAWGGDWKSFKDYPHFEMTGGLSLAECRRRWPGGWKPGKSDEGGGNKYVADDTLPLKLYSKDGSKKLVSKVQKALGIKVDGYYGPDTVAAVKAFQKEKGLAVDGIVGEKTWAKLFPSNDNIVGSKYKADDTLPLKLYSKNGSKMLVSKVQKKLGIKADGYYGPNTVTAVKDFQRKKGLVVDGIVGEKTWAALFPKVTLPNGILRRGDKGSKVKQLQKALLEVGEKLPKYGADGDFGAETEAAVKSFQRKKKLVVDGVYGPKTKAALEKAL